MRRFIHFATQLPGIGILPLLTFLLSACYTFTGTSIAPDVNTYFVHQFLDNAPNSLPALAATFSDDLRDKVRIQSRLIYTEENPDLEFKGTLVNFQISPEAPSTGERTAINRLTITLAVEYIDNTNEEKGWKRNFSFFYDFPTTVDFSSVEEEAISTISAQLMEDIFNAAFSDW